MTVVNTLSKEDRRAILYYYTILNTLLQEPDMTENVVSFALAEGNRPLGIFMDKESEFLSFPTIHCADNKERTSPVFGLGKLFSCFFWVGVSTLTQES